MRKRLCRVSVQQEERFCCSPATRVERCCGVVVSVGPDSRRLVRELFTGVWGPGDGLGFGVDGLLSVRTDSRSIMKWDKKTQKVPTYEHVGEDLHRNSSRKAAKGRCG
jgi:hypothetical protein